MKARHFFAGTTTHQGFVDYFDSIGGTDVYILKGCPGSGKSTLLKKIVSRFQGKCDIEYFHCAADPTSLDAVRLIFPNRSVSVIDGTHPHNIDPKKTDNVIKMTEDVFLPDVIRLENKKKLYFMQAQKMLKKAYLVHKQIEKKYSSSVNFDKISKKSEDLIQEIFGKSENT